MSSKRKKVEECIVKEEEAGSKYCRTCAGRNGPTVPIFPAANSNSIRFQEIIEKYLPIKVTMEDLLPLELCGKCAQTLSAFEELAEGVLRAETRLKHLLAETSEDLGKTEVDANLNDGASDSDDLPLSTKIANITKKKKGRTKVKERTAAEQADNVKSAKKMAALNQKAQCSDVDMAHEVKQLCLLCLKSVRHLEKHLKKHVPTYKMEIHFCSICGEPLKDSEELCRHVYTHSGLTSRRNINRTSGDKNGFQCSLCHTTFPEVINLLTHAATHLSPTCKQPVSLHCVVCGKTVLRGTLRRHLAAHGQPKRFYCEYCGREYAQESGLTRHVRAVHEGVRRYKCPVCPAVLRTNDLLRQHQDMHPDPRPFQCDVCGRTFLSQKHLYHHRKYHHTETGLRAVCSVCSRVFSSASVLRRHHRVVHLRLKEFQCEVCSAQLSTKQYLQEHLRTHTDERTEVCPVCGKTFQMAGNLRQHMKTHLERSQVCDVCGRRFTRRCQLVIHMGSHRGVAPPLCQICGKTFLLKSDMLKHAAEHPLDPIP